MLGAPVLLYFKKEKKSPPFTEGVQRMKILKFWFFLLYVVFNNCTKATRGYGVEHLTSMQEVLGPGQCLVIKKLLKFPWIL